jgi:16S rRNA (guanine1207-N2)-methyltransferase
VQPLTRLYQRNAERFTGPGKTLWVNLPGDAPWREWSDENTRLLCQDFSLWRQLRNAGAPARFGDFPESLEGPFARIVLSLPRSKERLDMMTACLADRLTPDGELWLAGENRAGIRSAAKRLRRTFGQVATVDRARHCALLRASAPLGNGAFEANCYATRWQADTPAGPLQIGSWPGVFAHGTLDGGTRRLLEALPEMPPGARVLDFGCGCGVVGAFLLARQPDLELVLIDSDAFACRSARETLALNESRAQVIASDGFSEVDGDFDCIVSNPPFHLGHRASASLTPALLAPAGNFLRPGGQFVLVANRHLPYMPWLVETFERTRVLLADNHFQVIACRGMKETTKEHAETTDP